MTLGFLSQSLYWLAFVTLVSGCLSGLWLSIWLVRQKRKLAMRKDSVLSKTGVSEHPQAIPESTAKPTMRKAIVLVLAVSAGFAANEIKNRPALQAAANTHTYYDVAIIKQSSPWSYTVQPAGLSETPIDFCEQQIVNWHAGETLASITYLQRIGCKELKWYHRAKEKVDARL